MALNSDIINEFFEHIKEDNNLYIKKSDIFYPQKQFLKMHVVLHLSIYHFGYLRLFSMIERWNYHGGCNWRDGWCVDVAKTRPLGTFLIAPYCALLFQTAQEGQGVWCVSRSRLSECLQRHQLWLPHLHRRLHSQSGQVTRLILIDWLIAWLILVDWLTDRLTY